MEAMFDDLAAAVRQPRADIYTAVRAFALDFASKLFLGVAVGVGIGIGLAIAR